MHIRLPFSSHSRRIDLRLGIYFHAASARRVSYFFFARSLARSRFFSFHPTPPSSFVSLSHKERKSLLSPVSNTSLLFRSSLAEVSQAFRIKPLRPFLFSLPKYATSKQKIGTGRNTLSKLCYRQSRCINFKLFFFFRTDKFPS